MSKQIKILLRKYRAQIDRIDAQLLKLLCQRSYIIPKVRRIKDQHINYKIAFNREFSMAYKLAKFHRAGLYDKVVIQRIWRELIGATLAIECKLTFGILVAQNTVVQDLWELLVSYFGVKVQFVLSNCIDELIQQLQQQQIDAVICEFYSSIPWWYNLPNYTDVKINTFLPFIQGISSYNHLKAVVLSQNTHDVNYNQMFFVATFNDVADYQSDIEIIAQEQQKVLVVVKNNIVLSQQLRYNSDFSFVGSAIELIDDS